MSVKPIRTFMRVMLSLCVVIGLSDNSAARAQGFGGLGTQAEGFDVPQRGRVMQFPADHASHPGFRIEWWYVTANLTGDDGLSYGLQWTLFRSALSPPNPKQEKGGSIWSASQLWMGHAAVTSKETHFVAETRSRGVLGLAGAEAKPFRAWINDWQMVDRNPSGSGLSALSLNAAGADFSYQLKLDAKGPLIFHGEAGYSTKSASGHASHYYSQPFFKVSGTLALPTGPVEVSGTAWLDREWSSQPLAAAQSGWDWVSLHLDDGSKLMGFQLRQSDGNNYTSATWISPSGETIAYPDGKLILSELASSETAGRTIPTRWRVQLPDRDLDLIVGALNNHAWMDTSFPYWEGPVIVSGSHSGKGYLEMTGYE